MLTWASEPPPGNVVTRGRWWDAEPGPPRVSVEDVMARQLGIDVGSRLTFDVQGVAIEAEVTSLRKVDWQSLTTNFFVVFSRRPRRRADDVRGHRPPPAATEAAFTEHRGQRLPNVTAIRA